MNLVGEQTAMALTSMELSPGEAEHLLRKIELLKEHEYDRMKSEREKAMMQARAASGRARHRR